MNRRQFLSGHAPAPTPVRGPYKALRQAELEAIEAKRKRLGITKKALAARAGIDVSGLRLILRSGRAFRRTVVALKMALRSLEKEQKAQAGLFEGELDAD